MKEIDQLRQQNINELRKELSKTQEALLSLRFEKATGALKKTHLLKITRRKIARLVSLIEEQNKSQSLIKENK